MKTKSLNKANMATSCPICVSTGALDSFGGHSMSSLWVYGLGCHWSLDWAVTNALLILTASVLYLGICPAPHFNELQVSQGARSSALAKPRSPLPLSFLIPFVLWDSPISRLPLPRCSLGSSGAREGAAVQAGAIVPQSGFVLILLAGGRRGAKG